MRVINRQSSLGATAADESKDYLAAALDEALSSFKSVESRGRVVDAVGTMIKVVGIDARVGDVCELRNFSGPNDKWRMHAEVVGIAREASLLMPYGEIDGISTQTQVVNLGHPQHVPVGEGMLGRILNGFGEPIDGLGPLEAEAEYPVRAAAPDALSRRRIVSPLQTGVRALDSLFTCGQGQRLGIFAPAATGKSSLLSMIARGASASASADVIVVGLIGERGREVGEFLQHALSPEQRLRTVCVVATSDKPAVERAKAANVATAVAEYFRDRGLSVLLLVDSVTRYARALREIGLAAGEPPTRRGYPPSVFTALPRLFERAGQNAHGSITAFYTVLVDDDESGDPIGEEMRAILDGHLVLSRQLAASGHFPAIDVGASRSRVMNAVTSAEHQRLASEVIDLVAKHQSIQMLVQIGEYQMGADPRADKSLRCHDEIQKLLRQHSDEIATLRDTLMQLRRAAGE